MYQKLQMLKTAAGQRLLYWRHQVETLIRRYWLRAFFLALGTFLLIRKDVSINVNLNAVATPLPAYGYDEGTTTETLQERPMNVSLLSSGEPAAKAVPVSRPGATRKRPTSDPDLANTYSNVTHYSDEDRAARAAKREKQLAYVKKYAEVARKEMGRFRIPASITLAQGLLESNVGESRLATDNNNHFGIKCFSRKCKKGHCTNFTDDSHKDFFRKYNSAWESFRAHSQLLSADRYRPLYKLRQDDYRGWAKGLKKAGYATDPHYAQKIIDLVEDLALDQYDR